MAIASALTLQAVLRRALRQTEGLIGSFLQLLRLDFAVSDHSPLSRAAGESRCACWWMAPDDGCAVPAAGWRRSMAARGARLGGCCTSPPTPARARPSPHC
ncbi:hypothetical protein E2C05_16975 [Paracraurococcus ruber]|uniref:Transposase DDE domain-containing protein n=1 Tax=Paracraurococcus ruber TaxID=77675 RepID=A0ABS1CZJ7_9PROT|nr:hypothetical protein [Paracraurococcus ruber]TDG29752.1 hypothetical protein E2C05_16975 [Paracraurococcus ruber]